MYFQHYVQCAEDEVEKGSLVSLFADGGPKTCECKTVEKAVENVSNKQPTQVFKQSDSRSDW